MIDCVLPPSGYMQQLRSWARENNIPLNINFELTPFCNFNCVMCYVHLNEEAAKKQGKVLGADEWLEIARQAKDMGTLEISLTGGEPFVHPEFRKIYSELNKMGFLITILSNGSLVDESMIEFFRENGMPYRMKLTVYGASNETYLKTCGSADGFTRVSKAIDLLKSAGVPLTLTSTIVKENADDLQQIYAFAREKGLTMQHTISVLNSSRGSLNSITSSRFALSDFPDELTLEELEKSKFPPLKSPFAWCASYRTSLWITWNGHLQLCAFMNKPFTSWSGNLKSDYTALHEKLEKIKSPAECSDCEWKEFCQRCPGTLCAESSDPERISESLCDTAKKLHRIYTRKKEN